MNATSHSEQSPHPTLDGLTDPSVVRHLEDLVSEKNRASDCWGSPRPILIESAVWVVIGALLWIITLLITTRGF